MSLDLGRDTSVFVVGAGIMGSGIAQVAAQAGHAVRLFDAREGAAAAAVAKLVATLDGLAAKGKIDAAEARAAQTGMRRAQRAARSSCMARRQQAAPPSAATAAAQNTAEKPNASLSAPPATPPTTPEAP